MAEQTTWASTANNRSIVPDSLMSGGSRPTLNQDRWSEHFQDLSGYCNTGSKMEVNSEALSGEQLNTPNIIVQDEFNFGLRSSPGERFDVFYDCDPWEASATRNTSQTELWGTVNNWLSTSNRKGVNDEEVIDLIDVDDIDPDETPFDIVTNKRQPLIKLDGDYLLSQSPADYNQSSPPQSGKDLNREQSYSDLISLLRPDQSFDNGEQQSHLTADTHIKNNNNNNNSSVNMNNVSNSNKQTNNSRFPLKSEQQTGKQQNNLFFNVSPAFKKSFMNDSISNSNSMNRRDPVNRSFNNLSSIFRSEEPIIGESTKQLPSCVTNNNSSNTVSVMANNRDALKVTAIIIAPKAVSAANTTATSTSSVNVLPPKYVNSCVDANRQIQQVDYRNVNDGGVEYIIPEIKSEPIDITDMEVESINGLDSNDNEDLIAMPGARKLFKMPTNNVNNVSSISKKPGLKLDIDSASRLMTSTMTPILTPTTSSSIVGEGNVSLSTPDVLRPLLNGNEEFNLLSYIGEDATTDDLEKSNINNVFSVGSSRNSPAAVPKKNLDAMRSVKRRSKSGVAVKCEVQDLPTLAVIKEEGPEEKHYEAVFNDTTDDDEVPPSAGRSQRRTTSKRRRVAKRSDDMEFDLGNLSDYAEEDDEKHDKTFQLTPYRRKRTISSTSRTSTSSSTYNRSKYYKETDSSDHESIGSGVDRYRELRDRNNEASRRSRLNRKSREKEMKKHAVELEEENRRLKAKADEMERLVKRLREGLMQLVLKKR